jgi:F-type H+-transporting ATPase subunit c
MTRNLVKVVPFLLCFLLPAVALAAAPAGAPTDGGERAYYGLAMAFAIGLAALGGGMGQGRAVAAALEGICRNPNSAGKVLVPMLLGLAFIESLVIFALIIAFTIGGYITPMIGGA